MTDTVGPRAWLGVFVAAACLAAAAANVPAADANAPAPPAGTTVTVSLPASRPADTQPAKARTVAGRIVLTDMERTVLGAVRDGVRQYDETGQYVMFAVAARAPELEPMDWYQLDRPAYANLLADPARYRATPLRAKVRVYRVRKLIGGAGLGFRECWPKGRPVWEMECTWADEPHEKDKPVIIYSVVDPKPLLGDPSEVGPQNRQKYGDGRLVRVAALFYKVLRELQESTRQPRDYPVMMAWQLSRTASWESVSRWDAGRLSSLVPLVILVIVLGAGFYYTRKRLAKLKQADREPSSWRRPFQYKTDQDRAGPGDEKDRVDGPVDPALTAAVEEFYQERQPDDDDDAAHDRG